MSRDDLQRAVAHATTAPSSHNSQPWHFRIRPPAIELRADPRRRLAVVDPDGRELAISCGAALFNLRCALRHLGHDVRVDLLPEPTEPNLLARVSCSVPRSSSDEEQRLFDGMLRRQSHRGPFLARPLAPEWLDALRVTAETEGAWLERIDTESTRLQLAELVAEGDRIQFRDAAFRKELASWMRPNADALEDGLTGYALGLGKLTSRLAPFIVRRFDTGRGQARVDRELVIRGPALLVLGTDKDGKPSWLAAGQALGRVLARAAAEGVSAGFMNQPIQCAALRQQVPALLEGRSGFAQVVVRLGYADLGKRSPRRPLEHVVD